MKKFSHFQLKTTTFGEGKAKVRNFDFKDDVSEALKFIFRELLKKDVKMMKIEKIMR